MPAREEGDDPAVQRPAGLLVGPVAVARPGGELELTLRGTLAAERDRLAEFGRAVRRSAICPPAASRSSRSVQLTVADVAGRRPRLRRPQAPRCLTRSPCRGLASRRSDSLSRASHSPAATAWAGTAASAFRSSRSIQEFVAVAGCCLQVAGPMQVLIDDRVVWERTLVSSLTPAEQIEIDIPAGSQKLTLHNGYGRLLLRLRRLGRSGVCDEAVAQASRLCMVDRRGDVGSRRLPYGVAVVGAAAHSRAATGVPHEPRPLVAALMTPPSARRPAAEFRGRRQRLGSRSRRPPPVASREGPRPSGRAGSNRAGRGSAARVSGPRCMRQRPPLGFVDAAPRTASPSPAGATGSRSATSVVSIAPCENPPSTKRSLGQPKLLARVCRSATAAAAGSREAGRRGPAELVEQLRRRPVDEPVQVDVPPGPPAGQSVLGQIERRGGEDQHRLFRQLRISDQQRPHQAHQVRPRSRHSRGTIPPPIAAGCQPPAVHDVAGQTAQRRSSELAWSRSTSVPACARLSSRGHAEQARTPALHLASSAAIVTSNASLG